MNAISARDDIMRAICANLAASRPHDRVAHQHHVPAHAGAGRRVSLPIHSGGPSAPLPLGDADRPKPERFRHRLEAVGGRCEVVADDASAMAAIRRILDEAEIRSAAVSDAAALAPLLESGGREARLGPADALPTSALFELGAGVTAAQWGIADTGTLVLESSDERHRLLSLIPPMHIAVLRVERLVDTLGEAIARVRGPSSSPHPPSRAITFITGPSRTSDIELTLAIGVHGPQVVHVILIDDARPQGGSSP